MTAGDRFEGLTQWVDRAPHVLAPDGSTVHPLVRTATASAARFELAPETVSVPVAHRSLEEFWVFVSGRGEMWRRLPTGEELTVEVESGVALAIPPRTAFQFRATSAEPLVAYGTTIPPFPENDPAEILDVDTHPWVPTIHMVEPGAGGDANASA